MTRDTMICIKSATHKICYDVTDRKLYKFKLDFTAKPEDILPQEYADLMDAVADKLLDKKSEV